MLVIRFNLAGLLDECFGLCQVIALLRLLFHLLCSRSPFLVYLRRRKADLILEAGSVAVGATRPATRYSFRELLDFLFGGSLSNNVENVFRCQL
jgi:hypothetical protein